MVAPPLAFSNSAIQAFCAASCAVEPAPAISPEASVDGAPPPSDSLSLLPLPELLELLLPPPQAARPSRSTQAAANTASHLELDISLLLIVDEIDRQGGRPWSERVSVANPACYLAAKPV